MSSTLNRFHSDSAKSSAKIRPHVKRKIHFKVVLSFGNLNALVDCGFNILSIRQLQIIAVILSMQFQNHVFAFK